MLLRFENIFTFLVRRGVGGMRILSHSRNTTKLFYY